jgi:mannitol/fructose-specific phosphotransferase system IIA component (Ntr-type)
MCLTNHILPELILFRIKVEDKASLLNTMIDCVMKAPAITRSGVSRERVYESILEREKIASTGIGGGFAFPHARMPELDDLGICLAVLEEPVEYESCDDIPVKIACMVLAPEKTPALALKVMSQVVRLLSDKKAKAVLEADADFKTLYDYLKSAKADIASPILARDIMREPLLTVAPGDSLKDITRRMSERQLNVIPVVDSGRIVGEISCERLFKLGIPDFFSSLKSVRFISEFDPFEKYFHEESESVASDAMSTKFCTMPPTATILEIVFALSVKRYPKIYIVSDNKLAGIIDQSTVLEKIINI